MTEKVEADILDNDLEVLKESDDEVVRDSIKSLLIHLEEAEEGQLFGGFCNEFRESYAGSLIVNEISIESRSPAHIVGSIETSFDGYVDRGACKDVRYPTERCATVSYEADLEAAKISFSTEPPDKQERFPNEEL